MEFCLGLMPSSPIYSWWRKEGEIKLIVFPENQGICPFLVLWYDLYFPWISQIINSGSMISPADLLITCRVNCSGQVTWTLLRQLLSLFSLLMIFNAIYQFVPVFLVHISLTLTEKSCKIGVIYLSFWYFLSSCLLNSCYVFLVSVIFFFKHWLAKKINSHIPYIFFNTCRSPTSKVHRASASKETIDGLWTHTLELGLSHMGDLMLQEFSQR